ncbi:dihydroneopterin aldolase [Aerophototrophica crusticola]
MTVTPASGTPGLDLPRLMLLSRWGEVRAIYLRDFALKVNIGIHDFEKRGPQRILVNIELFLKPESPGADEIAEVLDYDFLRREIMDLAGRGHFNLQETLLDGILSLCLAPPSVLGARVRTEKPDVYPDCAAVGLEAVRFKPGALG